MKLIVKLRNYISTYVPRHAMSINNKLSTYASKSHCTDLFLRHTETSDTWQNHPQKKRVATVVCPLDCLQTRYLKRIRNSDNKRTDTIACDHSGT